ncbi:MAG: response regulator, partial [Verrucomicrobiae bacterium]|nr:response regulator [Verrucomicrobiae bacterium]
MIPNPTAFTAPHSAIESPPGTIRVLVVDDEMSMRALGCAIVQSMGYEAIAVTTGEEAIETYRAQMERNEPVAAIIMDLALPGGMSGLETTDLLRAIDPKVAVIASSGYLQQNARAAAIERGF